MDSLICVVWRQVICMSAMTRWHVCHDSFMTCVPWPVFIRVSCSIICVMSWCLIHVCHELFICVPYRIRTWDMTQSYVWHDLFICVKWLFICVISLIYMSGMSHTCAWRALFKCVTHLIHMRDMPHLCVWRASFTLAHLNEARDTCGWGMPHIWIRHVTHLIQAFRLFKPKHTRKETHKMGGFPLLKKERKTRIKLKNYFLTVTRLQFSGLNICIHTARFITDDWRIQEAEKTGKRYVTNRW